MDQLLQDARELVEGLRYVEDVELADDDVVGCATNANDFQVIWPGF